MCSCWRLLKKSEDLKRGGLAVLFVIALLSLPTYMTGYSAQKSVEAMPGVSQAVIDLHQRSALLALIFMEATGLVVVVRALVLAPRDFSR